MSGIRIMHWRRHPESVTADKVYTVGELRDVTVVASACGLLVNYTRAVGDPEDVDCEACLDINRWLRRGEAGGGG